MRNIVLRLVLVHTEKSRVMVKMVPKCLVFVLWSFVLSADARPEPPYYYPTPFLRQAPTSQTFGASKISNFGQSAALAQDYNSLNTATNFNTAQQNYVIPSTSYGSPILRNTNAGVSVASSSASGGSQQGYSGAALPSRTYGGPDLISSNQAPSSRYIPQPRLTSIQKHIYVHVAPPDVEEETRQSIQQQQVPRQKHYKIIFIKTPAYNPPAQYIAQQQAQQEEKTLVYVLVKKPEEVAEVQAAQVASAPINKPEVYFIKYKAKNEQNLGGGQNVQQAENLQENNDSVVIESAAGRGASSYNQGYNYDRPTGTLNIK